MYKSKIFSFFLKIFLFVALFFAVAIVLDFYSINNSKEVYAKGNEIYFEKLNTFKTKFTNHNTIFLGSSGLYRHIDPILFDSLVNKETKGIDSYNLGVCGMGYPEDIFLLEKLIQEPNLNLENIIITLDPLRPAGINQFQHRTFYYYHFDMFITTMKHVFSENYSITTKIYRGSSFTLNYLCKIFSLYSFKNLMGLTSSVGSVDTLVKESNIKSKGFLPLDDYFEDTEIIKRNNVFKENLNNYKAYTSDIKEFFASYKSNPSMLSSNWFQIQNYNKIDQLCRKKDIKLYFIILPRFSKTTYESLFTIANELPTASIFNMSNIDKYPEFYQIDNSFDNYHLNELGAKIFTRILSEEFLDRKRQK